MDIYRFMNSKDIASYLQEINYEFNAMEAAYLIEQSREATIEEKIDAWQEVINIMPDCTMAWDHDVEKQESTHRFLREYIDLQRRMLDKFNESEGCVYFLRELRYVRWPDWLVQKNDSLWTENLPQPFSTLEACVSHLKAEHEDDEDKFDRYVIEKAKIDPIDDADGCRCNRIILDGLFRPLDVSIGGLNELDLDLGHQLWNMHLKLPIPFKRGDIVIDRTDRDPHPFVFDYLKFWNSAERAEHGCETFPDGEAEKLDRMVARSDERCGWDMSHMVACGYELGSHYNGGPLNDPCDLCFDVFGAGYNYLNLEYYKGPLEGNLKVLEITSQFMKGELSVEHVVNFSRLLALWEHADKLKQSYDIEYVSEVHHLYQGAGQ